MSVHPIVIPGVGVDVYESVVHELRRPSSPPILVDREQLANLAAAMREHARGIQLLCCASDGEVLEDARASAVELAAVLAQMCGASDEDLEDLRAELA